MSNNKSHCLLYSSKLWKPELCAKQSVFRRSCFTLESLISVKARRFSALFFTLLNFLLILSLLLLCGTKERTSSRSLDHWTLFFRADLLLLCLSLSCLYSAPWQKLVNSQLIDLYKDIILYEIKCWQPVWLLPCELILKTRKLPGQQAKLSTTELELLVHGCWN